MSSAPATPVAYPPEDPALTHRQILVIMSGLMMGMFLAALDQTIVSTALPTIVGDFHRSDLLSWVITAYLLASTATTPLWGKAGDLYGRKRVFQLAIVIFLVGSALCGASQNMYELIAFRGMQGIGGGGLISLVFAIIGDVIPPRERGRYQGYFGAVFGVSSVVGPLAGGFFVDSLSWRYIFYINLPLGIAALVVTNRVLRLPMRKRAGADRLVGRAAARRRRVAASCSATQSGGTDYPWGSWQIVGLFFARRAAAGRLRDPRGAGARADPAAEPVPDADLHGQQHHRVRQRCRDVRRAGLPAAVPAAGARRLGHRLGSAAAAAADRPADHEHRLRAATSRAPASTAGSRWPARILVTIGLALLTQLGAHTSLAVVSLDIFVFGAGLGLFMQVLTLVVQNAVPMAPDGRRRPRR